MNRRLIKEPLIWPWGVQDQEAAAYDDYVVTIAYKLQGLTPLLLATTSQHAACTCRPGALAASSCRFLSLSPSWTGSSGRSARPRLRASSGQVGTQAEDMLLH